MINLLGWLFSSDNFMPHGHCFLWQPATLWLNVGSDALISACYFAIPVALYYFVRHRKSEIAFAWVPLTFAAFILPCGVPDLTGYEVARRLRLKAWGREVFLIAMTGWGQVKHKELARQAGFDRHFTKPLDPGELQRELAAFFARRDR